MREYGEAETTTGNDPSLGISVGLRIEEAVHGIDESGPDFDDSATREQVVSGSIGATENTVSHAPIMCTHNYLHDRLDIFAVKAPIVESEDPEPAPIALGGGLVRLHVIKCQQSAPQKIHPIVKISVSVVLSLRNCTVRCAWLRCR